MRILLQVSLSRQENTARIETFFSTGSKPKLRQIMDLLSRIETTINSEIKEVRTIKNREKHIRITEQAHEVVRNRDKNRFPLERDFINEAIISYADRIEIKQLSKEFKALKKITEKLYKTVGWV